MPKDFNEIFREAAELSEQDRATLAGLLIESLEGEPDPDVEAEWASEIKRRVAELDAGTVKTIPWEEVRQRLLDRLKCALAFILGREMKLRRLNRGTKSGVCWPLLASSTGSPWPSDESVRRRIATRFRCTVPAASCSNDSLSTFTIG